ncbi:hypothetical protein FRC01_008587, partial [Tulasnella sp. 417]
MASTRVAQSSSSDRIRPSLSATATQGRRTSSAAIPNVVKAAAAAQTTASHSQAGPPPISAPGTSTSGFHSARQANMPLKMHVDVRSKPMPASVITPIPASNQAPNVAASTSTIPGSHAEVLQKGPILRPVEKGSPDSILPPSMPPASISPVPHRNRALSGSQAPPPTTLPLRSSSTAANLPATNEGSTLPSSGETIQPPNEAPPVLTPVRAARDTPVYTYSLPFGPPDSGPTFYQVSQAQLDNQFHLAWEQILKKAGNLHADLQKAILQHLQAVYKHICQTGVRQDDQYRFFIQSGMPRPPVPSTIATANQTSTTAQPPPAAVSAGGPTPQPPPGQIATMHPSTASDAAVSTTGGPARDGPSPDQRPPMEPRPNQTAQQIIDLITASEYTPVDAQMAPSSATRNLSPPRPLSTSQRAIPPVESLSTPPEAGPSAPNRATSFVETLRQNNPSAQDLADSIIRELGSPRKNARKRKFAPESDLETGQSSPTKGRRKSRLSGDQAQAIEHPSAGPQKDNSDSMGDNPVPMASAPGNWPSPLVPTPAPVREALPFNPYLPTVPTPLAQPPLRDLAVPIKVPGAGPTKPSADSASSLNQTTSNLNAPTNVPASESSGSSLRNTSQNTPSLNSSQEANQQLPQPNQLEPRPPAQPTVPANQSLLSLQSSTTNTPNIIPPTPRQPPTPAKRPNSTHLIPPPVYSTLPSPRRMHITTPPPVIAVLPASDDRHLSPSLEPASRGGDSEVDELMDDADENPIVGDAVAPVSAPTPPADALLPANNDTAKATETTEMSSLVRVRPRTEFWVEIPYRPDLLKKARKAPPSGLKPKARSGISRSRTTSRSASLSADGRVSRTPSQAGSQPN